jgi:hypothetical protein
MLLIQNFSETFIEAGCDEVGRGCLAGPVDLLQMMSIKILSKI